MSAFIFAQHYTGYEFFYVCRRGLAEVCKYFDIITASRGQRVRCLFICLFSVYNRCTKVGPINSIKFLFRSFLSLWNGKYKFSVYWINFEIIKRNFSNKRKNISFDFGFLWNLTKIFEWILFTTVFTERKIKRNVNGPVSCM